MLEIRSVSKSFPGVQALRNVSFTVQTGEVHALVGENGAGKSTLMKILSGVYPDYDGEVFFEGSRLALRNPRDAQQHGIAIIHQELNLVSELTVAENIFLGSELHTPYGALDTARMQRETSALLDRFNLTIPPDRPVKWLRVGEQQLAEVAKALALRARLLILDEPTSALSEAEIEHLFAVIAGLKQQGVTMIYISHKLDEVFRIADRVTVLRDGEYIGTRLVAETQPYELIRMMVGRALADLFPKESVEPGDELLRVEQLEPRRRPPPGQPCAARHLLYAAPRRDRGRRRADGRRPHRAARNALWRLPAQPHQRPHRDRRPRSSSSASPQDAIAAGLAFVTEDRKNQSLIVKLPVAENMTLAALKRFVSDGFLRLRAESAAVQRSIQQLHIKTPSAAANVDTLSGGNQQKVALAKCLLTEPRIFLLDEPTRGIDVGAKAEIYSLVSHLAQEGAAILMASSELPEILAMCDRVLVLCEGELTATLARAEATQERIMEAATALYQVTPSQPAIV